MLLDKLSKVKKKESGAILDRDMVCRCMGVRAGEVRECIRQGNTTLDLLEKKLGVMSACGFCKFKIQQLLEEEFAQQI